jgi:hypothetical protein
MAGEHLQPIVKCGQAVKQAGVHLVGQLVHLCFAQQVRAADIADEEEVAGQQEPGFRAACMVYHRQAHMLRRVTGRMDGPQGHCPNGHLIAIVHGLVLKCGAGLGGQVDSGAGAGGQFAIAGDVIGVEVGVKDVRDPQPIGLGDLEIAVHIALRVHHGTHARLAATDQIGNAAQALKEELPEDHNVSIAQSIGRCQVVFFELQT